MIILVDQDDVIADFNGYFLTLWRQKYPNLPYVPNEERKSYQTINDYPENLADKVKDIYYQEGFFKNLPLIGGAKEGMEEIKNMGNDVFICTSPITKYDYCVKEKYEWVEKYLGKEWTTKIILTRDKTLIHGDYLIDDNPNIKGINKPTWKHIFYDQPYNINIKNDLRLNWANYEEVFKKISQG
jgi:5'-nucleotidase